MLRKKDNRKHTKIFKGRCFWIVNDLKKMLSYIFSNILSATKLNFIYGKEIQNLKINMKKSIYKIHNYYTKIFPIRSS